MKTSIVVIGVFMFGASDPVAGTGDQIGDDE
jgi:hypothetical protein